jgi:hypothetical protein
MSDWLVTVLTPDVPGGGLVPLSVVMVLTEGLSSVFSGFSFFLPFPFFSLAAFFLSA